LQNYTHTHTEKVTISCGRDGAAGGVSEVMTICLSDWVYIYVFVCDWNLCALQKMAG